MDSRNIQAHLNLGEKALGNDCFDKAVYHFKNVIDLLHGKSGIEEKDFRTFSFKFLKLFKLEGINLSAEVDKVITQLANSQMLSAYKKLSEIYLQQEKLKDAIMILHQALELDPRNAELIFKLAESYIKIGDNEKSISMLEEAIRIEPDIAKFHNEVCSLHAKFGNINKALLHAKKALKLDPNQCKAHFVLSEIYLDKSLIPEALDELKEIVNITHNANALNKIVQIQKSKVAKPTVQSNVKILVDPICLKVRKGDKFSVRLHVKAGANSINDMCIYCLEPFGLGLLADPLYYEIPFLDAEKDHEIDIMLIAQRSSLVNLEKPWKLDFIATNGEFWDRASIEVEVSETDEGIIYYIITEDHELPERQKFYSPSDVRVTLIEKSSLAENIAKNEGAKWTHVVDIGSSYRLINWAAKMSKKEIWKSLERDIEDNLINVTYKGNDLGVHIHAFSFPSSSNFPFTFDVNEDLIRAKDSFLLTGVPNRKYWAKAYASVGDYEEPLSRIGSLMDVIKILEEIGRLGNPSYRAIFHRTGSLEFGMGSLEQEKSIQVLKKLGLLANSDVPKGSIYFSLRGNKKTAYFTTKDNIFFEAETLNDVGILEIKPEYNIETDYLSNLKIINKIVRNKVKSLMEKGRIKGGVHFITATCHDKYFNMRFGEWDNLNPEYGSWKIIASHINYLKRNLPQLQFETASEAVLAYYDYYTPELKAFRDVEEIFLNFGDIPRKYKYNIRLLGKDIPVDENHVHEVSIKPPSYFVGSIQRIEVYKSNKIIRVFDDVQGYPDLNFIVDDRSVSYSALVYTTDTKGPAIKKEESKVQETGIFLKIYAKQHFKKIHFMINKETLLYFKDYIDFQSIKKIYLVTLDGKREELSFSMEGNLIRIFCAKLVPLDNESNLYGIGLAIEFSQ